MDAKNAVEELVEKLKSDPAEVVAALRRRAEALGVIDLIDDALMKSENAVHYRMPCSPIAATPVKQPIVIRVSAKAGETKIDVLHGRSKCDDLLPCMGCLPMGRHFYMYGLSIVPPLSAPRAPLWQLHDEGEFVWNWGSREWRRFPVNTLMTKPSELEEFPDAPRRDLTTSGMPGEWVALESARPVVELPTPLVGDVEFSVVVWGVMLTPLTPGGCTPPMSNEWLERNGFAGCGSAARVVVPVPPDMPADAADFVTDASGRKLTPEDLAGLRCRSTWREPATACPARRS